MSATSDEAVTVELAYSGTASVVDYTTTATGFVIAAGDLTATATITAVPNSVWEGDKTIVVDVATATPAGEKDGFQQVTVTIIEDDPFPYGVVNIDYENTTGTPLYSGSGPNPELPGTTWNQINGGQIHTDVLLVDSYGATTTVKWSNAGAGGGWYNTGQGGILPATDLRCDQIYSPNGDLTISGLLPSNNYTLYVIGGGLQNGNSASWTVAAAYTQSGGDETKTCSGWDNDGNWDLGQNYRVFDVKSDATGKVVFTSGSGKNFGGAQIVGTFPAAQNAYLLWAGGKGLTPPDSDVSNDYDRGGLPNGVEWVVGGDPTDGSDDAGLAPASTDDGDNLVFVYRLTEEARTDPDTSIACIYGSDLVDDWTEAQHGVDGVTVFTDIDAIDFDLHEVTVTIPKALAVDGRMFATLEVVITE